jgi:hypothetical protein
MTRSLAQFLNAHYCQKGDAYTHTRIGEREFNIKGGSYTIPEQSEEEFYDLMYKEVIQGGKHEYLTERQNENGVVYVDLDFRYNHEVNNRQHNIDWIEDFLGDYLNVMKDVMKINESFKVFVMEKDNVNQLADSSLTKDGIHILIGVNCPHILQLQMREMMIASSEKSKLFENLPLINDLDGVFDIGLSKGTTNAQLFGCRKPAHDDYKLTYAYNVEVDPVDNEFCMNPYSIELTKETFMELCVRNKKNRVTCEFTKLANELLNKSKPKTKTKQLENRPSEFKNEVVAVETDDKYLELLNHVIKNQVINGVKVIDWHQYFHIAGMLKTNNYKESVFLDWAKLDGFIKQGDDEALWKGISTNKHFAMYGLQNIAKEVNEVGYKNWLAKHGAYISLEILDKGENDVAKYIKDQLISTLVFCNNRWFVCDKFKTGIWRIVTNPHATIISHIQNKIDESRELMLMKKQKEENLEEKNKYGVIDKQYMEHYKQVGKGAFSSQITKLLQDYLFDSQFENKLDSIPYKIAYKNGIMDLKTLKFRSGLRSSDFITKTIPYNYEEGNKEDIIKIKKELLKICNMNEAHLEYYLSTLGYSLTGDASKIQEFYCLRGQKASNGKSVVFEALTEIMASYVLKLESTIFETTYSNRHKEIARWRGIRIAWVNELSTKKQDENEIKNLADGTAISYKVMYGTMDIMPITFKAFIISNNTLNINADNGIKRRLKMFQLDSEFVADIEDDYETCRFKKDTSFGLLLQTDYKFALMDLLYSYSKKFVEDGYKLKPYPNDWNEESNAVVEDNNDLNEFIMDRFDFDDISAITTKADVEKQLKLYKTDLPMKHFKDALASMRLKAKYDSQKWIGTKKGWWVGIKIREVVEVVEVVEEMEEE